MQPRHPSSRIADNPVRTPALMWTYQPVERERGLLEYGRLLWEDKLAIVVMALLGGAIAMLASLGQEPVYQAVAAVELQGVNENYLNLRAMSPTDPIGGLGFDSYLQTQIEILKDPALLYKVVGTLKLHNDPEFSKSHISWLESVLGSGKPGTPVDNAMRRAAQDLRIRSVGQTRIVRISFDSPDPDTAAQLANALMDIYIQENLESRWKNSQKTAEWLQIQLSDVKGRLKKAEEALQTYVRNSGVLFTSGKDSVSEERLKQIQDELSRAQADRITKETQYEVAASVALESLPEVLSDTSARTYQARLTELRREHADASALLTSSHYKVQRLEAQIDEVNKALQTQLVNTKRALENAFRSAKGREQRLRDEYERQVTLILQQAPDAAQYATLKREVDTTRAFHEAVMQQLQEAGIAAAIRSSNIRPLGRAVPPSHPYKPNFGLNGVLGLFTGAFLAIGFVVVRDRTNRTFRTPGDTAMYLGVPELGVIPSGTERRTALAESFRATITSIIANSTPGKCLMLLITSPGPKEGKTLLAANLAVALAQMGRRVLAIDADFRSPRLSTAFPFRDNAGAFGMKDLLMSDKPVDVASLREAVSHTSVDRLDVLRTPSDMTDAPELLHSRELSDLTYVCRQLYDFVLIDTPPTLLFADARVLSQHTDGVVLVVRANQTRRESAVAAMSRLMADNLPIFGVVLNDCDPNEHIYGYRAYSKYSHALAQNHQFPSAGPQPRF